MDFIKKIMGWALLILGIFIIIYSLYSSYGIFTAKTEAPEIFSAQTQKTVAPSAGPLDIQSQLGEILGEQLQGILPTSSIFGLLNLTAWSIFAGILIFGGAQISNIGIKLIK